MVNDRSATSSRPFFPTPETETEELGDLSHRLLEIEKTIPLLDGAANLFLIFIFYWRFATMLPVLRLRRRWEEPPGEHHRLGASTIPGHITKTEAITKWDIFHYVYALLHHPDYRERYQANLKRDLPHLPYTPDFWDFAKAGGRLGEIHIGYEEVPEYPLHFIENREVPINWRVEKMKLSKDKTQLVYNNFLTLDGIPAKAFDYRLGNRSALEWVIDQYRVKTDKRSGIVNDPNRADDPRYIVKLIGKVIAVSLETVEIVERLARSGGAFSLK